MLKICLFDLLYQRESYGRRLVVKEVEMSNVFLSEISLEMCTSASSNLHIN